MFVLFITRTPSAASLLLVPPVARARVAPAARASLRRTGSRATARRWLVGLRSLEGTRLIDAGAGAVATVAALVASTSRGAILAFAASLLLAALITWARHRLKLLLLPVVLAALAVFWVGTQPLSHPFAPPAPG